VELVVRSQVVTTRIAEGVLLAVVGVVVVVQWREHHEGGVSLLDGVVQRRPVALPVEPLDAAPPIDVAALAVDTVVVAGAVPDPFGVGVLDDVGVVRVVAVDPVMVGPLDEVTDVEDEIGVLPAV